MDEPQDDPIALLLPFLDGRVKTWNRDTPEAIALFGWAVENMHPISEFCRISFNDSSSPAIVVNKFLRRLGLEVEPFGVRRQKRYRLRSMLVDTESTALIEDRIVRPLRERSRPIPGRPATGGVTVSFRLPPWLVMHYRLKLGASQGDGQTIKSALVRAALYVKAHPDSSTACIDGVKGAIAHPSIGWVDRATKFNQWLDPPTLAIVQDVVRPDEWKNDRPSARAIARLLVVSAALDGVFEPDKNHELITFGQYQSQFAITKFCP